MNRKKVKFFSSIKFKVTLMVVIIAIACNVINIVVASINASDNVTKVIQESMVSLAEGYGLHLDNQIATLGAEAALNTDTLYAYYKNASVRGMDSAYAYIVSRDGVMLYHNDQNKIGGQVENQAVKDVVAYLKDHTDIPKPTFVRYFYKEEWKYAGYYVTSGGEAIVIVTANETDATSIISEMRGIQTNAGIITVIVAIFIGFILTAMIINPLTAVSEYLLNLSELKLKKDEKLKKLAAKKDEVGMIATDVYEVMDVLSETIVDIRNLASDVNNAADVLLGTTGNAGDNVGLAKTAMDEITVGVSAQAESTESCADNIDTIVKQIEQANAKVNELSENAEDMHMTGRQAIDALNELVKANEETVKAINDIYEQAKLTNESVSNIREATEIISSVADQTNLLSLNASIEAARAGEAGRGFAVVASEIQSLSNQTAQATTKIGEVINRLNADSAKEMSIMEDVMNSMEKQNENVNKTSEVFNNLADGIRASIRGIKEISDRTAEMSTASNKIIDVVADLSAVAEENAASTQETGNSVNNIASSMGEMTQQCDRLREIAQTLDGQVAKFEL